MNFEVNCPVEMKVFPGPLCFKALLSKEASKQASKQASKHIFISQLSPDCCWLLLAAATGCF
jgi:hypothetical protein